MAVKAAGRKAPAKKTTAKKAPTKKSPAKKPAAAKGAPAPAEPELEAATSAEAEAQTEPDALPTAVVPFHGRGITVQMATLDQLTIFKRTAARLEELAKQDQSKVDGQTAMKLYDRAFNIVAAVLVVADDVEWLEDQLLTKKLTLPDTVPLMVDAIKAVRDKANAEAGNRAERREAGKKARLAQ